jgi:GntR family transcriptional regulator
MLFEISTSDTRPIYLQIMDEVHRAVVVGDLAVDDPLPSVRELAGRLGINPNTVKQAYRELEREGVVYVRRGLGTFVANGPAPEVGRARLAREIARRALREAYRSGIGRSELMAAIRREDGPGTDSEGSAEETS